MPDEIFDVVNQQDEVVDRRPRHEVHHLGLLHRAVHVLVYNRAGRVFLQKRSARKDRHPGVWDSSVSGHVDSGETYDQTAVREVREEIGLELAHPPQRLFKLAACEATDAEFIWIYRCEHEGPFQLNAEEIEAGEWFLPAEVTRWMRDRPEDFAPALIYLWSHLKS
jgi:isopentenyldiphosphate isomerase